MENSSPKLRLSVFDKKDYMKKYNKAYAKLHRVSKRHRDKKYYLAHHIACKGRTKSNDQKMKDIVNSIKDVSCKDCGNKYPPICMDFDHRDPKQKLASVSALVSWGKSKQVILDEIAKCDVVCSNCHRIRTSKTWI